MAYLVESEAGLIGRGKGLALKDKTDPEKLSDQEAMSMSLTHLEQAGWTLTHVVPKRENAALTKYILHKEN